MKKTLVNLVINIFTFIEGKTSKDEYGYSALKRMDCYFKCSDNTHTTEYVYIYPFKFIRVELEGRKYHFIVFRPFGEKYKPLE